MLPIRAAGESPRIHTAGEILPDGTTIELIRDPVHPNQVQLACWREELKQSGPAVSHGGQTFAPLPAHDSVWSALRLPTHVAAPETTRELFDAVHDLLRAHLGQLETCTKKLVFSIFASWFSPTLPMAPITWISTPRGSPKNQLLQLLDVLCRRPLRLAGVSRGDLRSLPMSVRPTLLLDEPDIRPATQAVLAASARRRVHIRDGNQVVDIYGPKFIFSQEVPRDTALETDILRVALIPAARELMLLDSASEEKIAEEFQARFLGYFLRNCRRVKTPGLDVSNFTLPVQDLVRALGAAVVEDKELQSEIPRLLADQDEEIRTDLAHEFESIVLESMLLFTHQGKLSKVRSAQLAEQAAAIYRGRGFDREVSAETAGRILRKLAIPSGRLDKAANGVELTPQVCRLVHQLAVSYGVRAMQSGFRSGCRYCDELGLGTDQRKVNLEGHIA